MKNDAPGRRSLAALCCAAALSLGACGTVLEPPKLKMFVPKAERFTEQVERTRMAQHALIHGDAGGFADLFAHDDDVVLIDARGGPPLKGWSEIEPYLEAQAKTFMEGDADLELISATQSGGRMVLTFIEKDQVLFAGEQEPRYYRLRVTHILEERDGAWKLIYRHADPLTKELQQGELNALLSKN